MKNYFKRNCFFILFVFLMFQSHSTLWAMDGAGMAFKVSLSGKIYHQFSFLLEEDIRPKSNFKQAEWFLTTGEINYTFNRYLKAGVAYMLLNQYKASEELRNDIMCMLQENILSATLSCLFANDSRVLIKQAPNIPRIISGQCSPSPIRSVKRISPLLLMPKYLMTQAIRVICTQTGFASQPEAIIR